MRVLLNKYLKGFSENSGISFLYDTRVTFFYANYPAINGGKPTQVFHDLKIPENV